MYYFEKKKGFYFSSSDNKQEYATQKHSTHIDIASISIHL